MYGRAFARSYSVPRTGSKKRKFQENSSKLELSISKNTPHGRWGQGPGTVYPRFPAGLPFPVPEILVFVAFGDSGKSFQQFSRNFPGTFLQNSRTDPRNSHSLLEFSEIWGHFPILRFFLFAYFLGEASGGRNLLFRGRGPKPIL